MSTRRMIRGIPHRPHFDLEISGDDVAGTIHALEISLEKNGFQTNSYGFFYHAEGTVKVRYYKDLQNCPKASIWCFPSNENDTKSEIEAFAKKVEKIIRALPDVNVKRDDGLLYKKRYAVVSFPDDDWRWVEPPDLWFDNYFEEPVVSYIRRKMRINLKNHRKFFETVLARNLEKRWTDKNLDLLCQYHYSAIFWLAVSRMNLDQLIGLIGITDGKLTRLKGGYLRFKLQTALCSFLTNMSSALEALAQIVNLRCRSKPDAEHEVRFKKVLGWVKGNYVESDWKGDISYLKTVFLESKCDDAPLVDKCSEIIDYRNVIVHRRLMPLVDTVRGTYSVEKEAGRLVTSDSKLGLSQLRSVAVHIPSFEAGIDRSGAVHLISIRGRLFLPRIQEKHLVYDYPIDRSQFNREDVLLQFEKYYECVSSLIEKVYAVLLDMQH